MLTNKILQGTFLSSREKASKKSRLVRRDLGSLSVKYINKEKRNKGLLDRISFRALNISVKGRLKGVRRARGVKVHFRGTRPNSFAQPEHSKQLPIKTKWGILSMTLALN